MKAGYEITGEQRAAMRTAKARMAAMAARKGFAKRLSYAIQAIVLWPFVELLRILPLDAASAFGGWIGRTIVYGLIDRANHYETMRVAFPQARDAELNRVLRGMCDNIGRVLGETMHLTEFTGARNPRLKLVGVEAVESVRALGVPLLFISGHFGNWELDAVALRAAGFDGISAVQHPNNPHVLEWIARERYSAAFTVQVGAGEGIYAAFRRSLKAGGAVALLADQRVLNGINATFFGVETMTNLIPARLARELGAAVVFVANRRVGGARFEIELQEPFTVTRGPDRASDERAFSDRMNKFFEEQIRAAPDCWLWGHPRFDDAIYDLDHEGRRIGRKASFPHMGSEFAPTGDETSGRAD